MRRFIGILAVALLAGTTLAVTGPGAALTQPVAALSCPSGQVQADVTLLARTTLIIYNETYYGGGLPTFSPRQTLLSAVPSGKATFTFCTGKSGTTWTVRKADLTETGYYHIDSNLHSSGLGFALKGAKVNTTSLVVEPTVCNSSSLDLVKEVLGLPVPGIDYVLTLGGWIVGHVLPADTTNCRASDITVPIHFNSVGNTSVSDFAANYVEKDQYKTGYCATPPNLCYHDFEYRWKVTSN